MRVESFLPLGDWRRVGPVARASEAAGFDALLSAEIAHDPFAPLVVAALETSTITLGTGIVVAFPRSPMIVANTARDLQVHSGGRFSLGLGSQVKGHNERRFSVPWGPPVPRLREYVQSLRAIWRAWETREPLAFEGEHYRFTLMTPEFSPPPTSLPPIPVSIAAVRPPMIRMAGRICDGVKLHGFATRPYLEQVALPALREGLAKSGRPREQFEISGGGFVVTGATDEEVAKQFEMVRYRLAFYGATRTYHVVFEPHGWEDLGMKLHRLSKEGKWDEMAKEVSDEVVHEFSAVGRHDQLRAAVERRFGGLTDSMLLGLDERVEPGALRELIQDLHTIPCAFRGFADTWEA